METSNNGSNHSSIECLKMRELIDAINEYLKTRTENRALIIKKFLQMYSVTIDVSAFDPDTSLGAQFYVSLYELLTKLEPESQMAWDCVDVLYNACRNCSARQALIDTYQFVPSLSKLLGDQLSNVKKKKLLRLMQISWKSIEGTVSQLLELVICIQGVSKFERQHSIRDRSRDLNVLKDYRKIKNIIISKKDLTCGIKLSWQVPHLPHLLKTLTKWIVEDKDQDIVCSSLCVLVNLCYKNLPTIYTLSTIVDIKKFLRFCLPLKGPLIEVQVCKLMIILDQTHNEVTKKTLSNLIHPTFISALESLKRNDPVMLGLVIYFFIDVVNSESVEILKQYVHYNEQVAGLIQLIEMRNTAPDSNTTPVALHEPECVMLILKFIYTIEIYKLADLSSLYPRIIKLALDWLQSHRVSYQALLLLAVITENASIVDEKKVLKLLSAKLPVFLSILQYDSSPNNMEGCKRLGSLLQLMRTMLKSTFICKDVLQSVNETVIMQVFSPVLSDDLNLANMPRLKVNENNTTSTDYVNAYVYAVGLVNELSQHDARWLELLSTLMENRTIHSFFALALYGSEPKVKELVLEMTKYARFPIQKVASAMESSQNMFSCNGKFSSPINAHDSGNMAYPVMSSDQMGMLDGILNNLKRLVNEQNISNISTSQVMELYQYKIASLSHSELSATKSLEAASERCVHLQHRLAQLTAEHNKLSQLIHQYENRIEKSDKKFEEMRIDYSNEKQQANSNIDKMKKELADIEKDLKDSERKLREMTEKKTNLEQEIEKRDQVIQKLEEYSNRVDRQLQKKEEQLTNANKHIDNLNLQNQDLQKILSQKEAKLAETTKQYLATKDILTTITKVANSQIP